MKNLYKLIAPANLMSYDTTMRPRAEGVVSNYVVWKVTRHVRQWYDDVESFVIRMS